MARFCPVLSCSAALLLWATLAFFAPGAALAGAPVISGSRVDCVEDADKDDAGRAADEAACLALTGGAVRRDGDRLIVRRPNGVEMIFDSNPAACAGDDADNCRVVSLYAYDASRGFAIVEEGFYEGLSVHLVDLAGGDKVDIMARPHFAPSGNQLVAVIADLMNEPEYEILLYDLTAPPFRRGFAAKHGTAAKFARANKDVALFDFVAWDGEDHVRLKLMNDEAAALGTVTLDRAKGKWGLKSGKAK